MTKNTNKKGITAVVAVVLLLMMTVAAAGLAYMWISGMQADTQAKTNAQVETQQEQMLGALSIDSVWVTGGSTYLQIRNVGSSTFDATAFKIYIDGVDTPPTGASAITSFAPKASDTITISGADILPNPGEKMEIRVVAANGVEASHTCKIPTTGATYC